MPKKSNLSMRQMIEGMTLVFDPIAAKDLEAVIQFKVTGAESGAYFLKIAEGDCTFHLGLSESPSLTIETQAEVWQKISRGELSGQEALLQGLYQVQGDLELLLKLDQLFSSDDESYMAPSDQRPPGPIPLSGMVWMPVTLIPWMVFWITFEMSGPWVSIFIPFLLSLFLAAYRLKYGSLTILEAGSLGFFTLAGVLSLTGVPGFDRWGSVVSSVIMAALWLGSLLVSEMPLCGQYSKWGYTKRLSRTTMFIHPNAVISLVWGWQFLAASLFGLTAVLVPDYKGSFTVVRYLLLVPAFIFTVAYQKGAPERRIEDIDRALVRIRFWGGIGLAAGLGIILATLLTIKPG